MAEFVYNIIKNVGIGYISFLSSTIIIIPIPLLKMKSTHV